MSPVLNVLQLIPTLDRSGAEKQMVLLAKGLPRDRFRVEVAALDAARAAGGRAPRRRASRSRAIGKRLKVDPLALARLVRFLQARRFDVVQTWIFAANTYGRVAAHAGGGAGGGHGRDGRRPLEGPRRSWRSTAAWRAGPTAWWATRSAVVDFYRKAGIPDDRLAMIHSGIGDEEPPPVDRGRGPRRVRLAGRRPAGPLRRPAGAAEGGRRPDRGARPAPARPARRCAP